LVAQEQGAADTVWVRAVDGYLVRDDERAVAVLTLSPDEITRQSQDAFASWTSRVRATAHGPGATEERRLAIRRLQASALLSLEVLLPASALVEATGTTRAFEDAGVEAWERLARFETPRLEGPGEARREAQARHAVLRRFRDWWRAGFLQHLLNAGRFAEFRSLARMPGAADGDPRLHAEVLLLRGMVEETSSRMLDGVAATAAGSSRRPESRLRAADMALAQAATSYTRAIEAAPGHREARLRLGRVLLERGRPEQALRTLEPLTTARCTEWVCGLAALFSGEAQEARGAKEDAAAAYAKASSAIAVRQSALLALMQLAIRRGEAAKAFDMSGQFLAKSPLAAQDTPDAWSVYVSGRRPDPEAVLGPLREAVLP
jgi:hypothetical protein